MPYAGVYAATWPVVRLAEAEDRSHAVSRLVDLVRLSWERSGLRSTISFGYETSVGFSLVGVSATAVDWPEPGGSLRLSGGYLRSNEDLLGLRLRTAPRDDRRRRQPPEARQLSFGQSALGPGIVTSMTAVPERRRSGSACDQRSSSYARGV